MSQASTAIRSLPIHAIGGSLKPTRTSRSRTGVGALAPTAQIHGRTAALAPTERNASRRPLGDQTALKKPRYEVAFELSVRSIRAFTSSSAISFVGTELSSVRPGLVNSIAA